MFNLVIGFLNDFLLIAGGIIVTAMGVAGQMVMPSTPVLLFATLSGFMQATRRMQSKLDPSPTKPEAIVRTPEQLMQQIHDNEATASALIESVTRAVAKADVTPKRVEAPPPQPAPVPKQDFS